MYFEFIPSPNFRVLKNGRMFLDYKYRQKIECFPLVLQLKTLCSCFTGYGKATCKARLNHLSYKNTYNGIKLLNILKLNSYISLQELSSNVWKSKQQK